MVKQTLMLTAALLLSACGGNDNGSQQNVFLDDGESASPPAVEPEVSAPLTETEQFLAENATRAEVSVTESGLQYEVLKASEGPKPKATSYVTVHYVGTLTDGTEFDSSIARGQPSTFPLDRVIAGWTEGLQLMSVGSQYRFFIPSDLAYGDQARGEYIKPGDTLVFEVELLEINSN